MYMEDNLNSFEMEDDLNFLKMEDDLNVLKNGWQPKFSWKWKTT